MTKCRVTKGVLHGIKILDFTTFLSGPFATQTLGDLGAEVIKVESRSGDLTRSMPPHFAGEDSIYYMSTNRNKKSLVIDLKHPEGKDVIIELAKSCNVVMENFRPGVAKRLGINYDALKTVNPGLVYCSISGFGQEGGYSFKPAYDMIVQALGGTMSITGEKGADPVRLGPPMGDLAAGLYSVIGILGAVMEQRTSGKGKYIDISMLDCQLALLSYLGAYYLHSGNVPSPQGREHESVPTYRALKAADGEYVVITANTQKMFEGVCKSVQMEQLIQDPRFADSELRLQYKAELVSILEEAFRQFDSGLLLERLESNDVPCAPIRNVKEALEDPQNKHRNMVVEVTGRSGTTLRLIGNPIKYADEPDTNYSFPPALGEHTAVLLEQLGFSREKIERLASEGIVYSGKTTETK